MIDDTFITLMIHKYPEKIKQHCFPNQHASLRAGALPTEPPPNLNK